MFPAKSGGGFLPYFYVAPPTSRLNSRNRYKQFPFSRIRSIIFSFRALQIEKFAPSLYRTPMLSKYILLTSVVFGLAAAASESEHAIPIEIRARDCARVLEAALNEPSPDLRPWSDFPAALLDYVSRDYTSKTGSPHDDVFVVIADQAFGLRNLSLESTKAPGHGIEKVPGYWIGSGDTTWMVYSGPASAWVQYAPTDPAPLTRWFYVVPHGSDLFHHVRAGHNPSLRRYPDREANLTYLRKRLYEYLGSSLYRNYGLRDALLAVADAHVPKALRESAKEDIKRLPFTADAGTKMALDPFVQRQLSLAFTVIAEACGIKQDKHYSYGPETYLLKILSSSEEAKD